MKPTISDSDQRFREFFENINIGVALCDFSGKFLEINIAFCDLTGYSKKELNRMTFKDITYPNDRQMMIDYILNEVIREQKPFAKEYRIIRKNDNETRWVYGYGDVTFVNNGNILEMIGTIQDITDRKKIENDVSAEKKEVQLNNLKILIVEDDEISYTLLARTLHKISKEVLRAINGVEAVEACRNNPDLDLVLMDIRMPMMNGLEATQKIRQFNKEVIIIAQTAYAFTGDNEKALEAGCNDYITKPINLTLLLELIKIHFNK